MADTTTTTNNRAAAWSGTGAPFGVVDGKHLRRCLGRFATGVTVVTFAAPEGVRGVTVNSFTSVSLDPPLVLVSIARKARSCEALEARPFAINVLRSDQIDTAYQFAGRPRPDVAPHWEHLDDTDPFAPSLSDAIAVFQCRPWRRYDGGDHVLVVGEVVGAESRSGEPLLFSDGAFAVRGMRLFDGPLVVTPTGAPVPSWSAPAQRLWAAAEAC